MLHRYIQLAFDWHDCHLFAFEVGNRRFEANDREMEGEDAAQATLRELGLRERSSFLYVYDLGDGWEHDIVVRGFEPGEPGAAQALAVECLDGARAGPLEDAGGPLG